MPAPRPPQQLPAATPDEVPNTPLIGQKGPGKKLKTQDVIIAITLPWLTFFLIICLFLFAFRDVEILVWILIAACVCMSLLFLCLGVVAKHIVFACIGLLCLVSCAAGTALGLWLDDAYLQRYGRIVDKTEFKDVDPYGDVSATHDAGIIQFNQDAFVDDRRTIGWIDGSMYCVAPVVSPRAYSSNVQYWATGEDCCEARSNFECGDAREIGVVTAIPVDEDVRYRNAVEMAISLYNLNGTAEVRLLEFAKDPQLVASDIWDEALSIALVAAAVDLLMSALTGLVLVRVAMSKARAPAAL